MAFCIRCGQPLVDGAKFCATCGMSVTSGSGENEKKRETIYDGEIHKCPHCGEALKAFESVCPTCKFELRGVKGSSSVKELAEKIERATSESQKISIIKNFPIPNTREDILEFMILAAANFDAAYYAAHLDEEDSSDAWLSMVEQCYQKAKLVLNDQADFEKVERIYLKIKKDCLQKESKFEREKIIRQSDREREEEAKIFKKSKFRIVLIIFAAISALISALAFDDNQIASGMIALTMCGLFITAFLMGSGAIKERVRNIRVIPTILAFTLFAPYFSMYSLETDSSDRVTWDDIVLNEYAPEPNTTSMKEWTNSREKFYVYDIECSQKGYYDYVDACKAFGYDYEIIEEDENSFKAYNEEGYQIRVCYIATLTVELII